MRELKYYIVTYGCQMNAHDSEKIAGMLQRLGYRPADAPEGANAIVFNTCCIRENAENRAYGNIGALKPYKQANPETIIAVCGCMTQQEGAAAALHKKFPFVDIVLGTHNLDRLEQYVAARQERNGYYEEILAEPQRINDDLPLVRSGWPTASVNIMYGCNNFCTYCIVPYVRGRERSRAFADILNDVSQAVSEGYPEIMLLGQNVNSYGKDSGGESFADLLTALGELPQKIRVRFMTSHPKDLTDDVIDAVARYDNLCKSIHLPVQSGSNVVLKHMNRRYTREHYLELAEKIYRKIPSVRLTSDLMIGFPGETDEDFSDTLDLMRRVRFSNAFTFVYSRRSGTVADRMEEQVPEEVKKSRITAMVELQNAISKEVGEEYLGHTYELLVEGVDDKREGFLIGRTSCNRTVKFPGPRELIGRFIDVKITEAGAASLSGVPII